MNNEILEEVWRIRDEFAKRHNYDLDAIVATLQEAEQRPWTVVVDGPGKKPNHAIPPTASGSGTSHDD